MWTKDDENITSSKPVENPCNCISTIDYAGRLLITEQLLLINVTSVRDYGVYTCIERTLEGGKQVTSTIIACLQSEF